MANKEVKIDLANRPRQDFNKENQDMIDNMKKQMENPKAPSASNSIKMVIEPNDTVIFNGKQATVVSTWPGTDDVILMVDGMTVECTKKQCQIIGRTDTMECPMKFKNGIPVYESQKENTNSYVRVSFTTPLNMVKENLYVDFNEWSRKKGKQKVRIINEEMIEVFDAPKSDTLLLDLPDGNIGKDDGYIPGVTIAKDGEAEQKIMIKANEYATSTDDSQMIHILRLTASGYEDDKMPKGEIKTLSV